MNVIVLAAGHGTRLERDLTMEKSAQFAHLHGLPKVLLPIAGLPLLSHWMKMFESIQQIDHIYIGTNNRFFHQLEQWKLQFRNDFVSLVSDGTETVEERLGAVSCISQVAKHFEIDQQNAIVMAGDLLFKEGFDLKKMLERFRSLADEHEGCTLVATYDCAEEVVHKHGIVEVDQTTGRVATLLEKPLPSETKSRKACPCFYMFTPGAMRLVDEFLSHHNHLPLELRDAPGNFIKFLITRKYPVFAYDVRAGRFDVGNLQSYRECDRYFAANT